MPDAAGNDRKRIRSESEQEVAGNPSKVFVGDSIMSNNKKCYCRGDDITSMDLDRPEHLMPMIRPFSMRVSNLLAGLSNMAASGALAAELFRGGLLVSLWHGTRRAPLPAAPLAPAPSPAGSLNFTRMPLQMTKPAPQWKATAVVNGQFKDVSLADYKGKYVVLFFYPLDFTFVCPTEIIAFSEAADDFRKINCEVLAASTDSHFCHLAWVNTPRKQGGLGPMNIPLLSDKSHRIARDYGVLNEETGVPFRGLFIIDELQNLRQVTINDLPVGRSVEETLRLVQAFQFTDKHGEVCPANWRPGSKTIKPDSNAAKEYFMDSN